MIKKLIIAGFLAIAFAVPSVYAQGLPQQCDTVIQSMVNLYYAREEGVTVKEAIKIYTDFIVTSGGNLKHPAVKRVMEKIKDILGRKELSQETMIGLLNKELDLCLQLKGDYSQLRKT